MRLNPLIGGFLLAMFLCCSSYDGQKLIGHQKKIAYNVLLPGKDTINYEVYIMDIDGENQENLSNHPAVDWLYHGWSHNIYFISDRDTTEGIYFLYQQNLRNRTIHRISTRRMAESWLDSRHGGSELIICTINANYRSIMIIDTTGSEIREVMRTNQYMISDPAFSPDGKWIVFRSDRSGIDELWISDELGANQRRLTNYPPHLKDPGPEYYHAGPPRWIPGTNSISYTSRRDGQYHIFTINTDGNLNKQITMDHGNQSWHSWSPDGQHLIFDGTKGESPNSDIYLLHMENQKLTKLTETGYPERAPIFITLQ